MHSRLRGSLAKRGLRAAVALGISASSFAMLAAVSAAPASAAASDIVINEVESNGDATDWVELYNKGTAPVDISGWKFIDNQDVPTAGHPAYVIPAGTIVPAGGHIVLDGAQFGWGLGAPDSARLFFGATNLVLDPTSTIVDQYAWTAHALPTYGRCPNGTGAFTTTVANPIAPAVSTTKGSANACTGGGGGPTPVTPWPGSNTVTPQSTYVFGGNMSGLDYEPSGTSAPGVLWGARNGPGALFRLVFDGTNWVPDSGEWATGKLLRYTDGTGDADAEGVTMLGASSADGIYIASERNNTANTVSRLSILRYNANDPGTTLTATNDWNITADIVPAVGANLGLEGITWIPDTFLVSKGFFDESKGRAYNPADYAKHTVGLFFVGIEGTGKIYAYALNQTDSGYTRIATIDSGFVSVMDLQFDNDLQDLWAVCDNTCTGRAAVLRINGAGKFVTSPALTFERPTGMPDINNEGFAIAPAALCSAGLKPVYWSDDSETGGVAIRGGLLPCAALTGGPDPVVPEFPFTVFPIVVSAVGLAGWFGIVRRRRTRVA
jgi:Lamin Tail Domain